jgi:Rrf2 family protein
LRALLILAAKGGARLVLGRDISKRAGIPANYLSKLMLTLAAAEVVEAVRGSNGGYRLRRPAAEIALIDIVRLFDRQLEPNACFLGLRQPCSDLTPCPAHEAWKGVKTELIQFLEGRTLADISEAPGQVQ